MTSGAAEEQSLHTTLREFAERELVPLVGGGAHRCRPTGGRILPRLDGLGLPSIGVPDAMGGAGGTSTLGLLVHPRSRAVCPGIPSRSPYPARELRWAGAEAVGRGWTVRGGGSGIC